MEIKKILESGLMESYVLGIATEEEVEKVLMLKKQSQVFEDALTKLELDMEMLAQKLGSPPPAGLFEKIETELNEIQLKDQSLKKVNYGGSFHNDFERNTKQERYIEVESESNQMRINKAWRWVFAAVFILGKIFLAAAIYFYLESRQAKEQIKTLKIELQQQKGIK